MKRNDILKGIAPANNFSEKSSQEKIESFLTNYGMIFSNYDDTAQKYDLLTSLLEKLSDSVKASDYKPTKDIKLLKSKFIQSFAEAEQPFAHDLLTLAQRSYQLRDDDNIYLGRIEGQLNNAILESGKRLGSRCEMNNACTNYEELIRAIKDPDYVPCGTGGKKENSPVVEIKARQLRGQPASKGIARGNARVVNNVSDLFAIQKGEILVCNAIDPNMTFVIPLVAAIVERRGGMLIHGAIIAREYGLPCVTGIPQATEFIRTGDDITVDGYFGLVINHAKSPLV
jgi:pyruvate,water dikinase